MTQTASSPAWLRAILNRRMLVCIFTGFASGLPLYLLFNLVPAWLTNESVSLKVIGVFALAQFPFTWKFLWAPLLDRYNVVSWLGRRRGWMFVTQIGLVAAIAWLGHVPLAGQRIPFPGFFEAVFGISDPVFPWQAFVLASVIALLSATQDIALDAFRREILPDEELGLGNAIHVNAYRIAGLVPGSLSLILADRMPWEWVFAITAAFMVPGLAMTLLVKEPAMAKGTPRTLGAAVVEPFNEFFSRHGLQSALLVLAFLFLYKLGDSLCTALATPFYLNMGFSNTEIGIIAKNAGLWPSVIGGILGGIWMIRLGINRALWLFGVVQVVSILGFAGLAWVGPPYAAPREYGSLPPEEFVRHAAGDVLANACAHKEELAGSTRNMLALVSNSAKPYFDIGHMARLAIGPDLEKAPRDQKKKLTEAFRTVFTQTYAGAVVQHCGWKLEPIPPEGVAVTTSTSRPDAHTAVSVLSATVTTTMRQEGGQAITVAYAMEKTETWRESKAGDAPKKDQDTGWKLFDIAVDGQSLVEGYRGAFAEQLSAGGLGRLADWLREQSSPSDPKALLALALVISLEALGVGLGSAAFVAFMARTTHPAYTATQLALFTSLMAVPRTLVNASAGWLVEGMDGWFNFFWLCFFLAIPGMLLLFKVAPWNGTQPAGK